MIIPHERQYKRWGLRAGVFSGCQHGFHSSTRSTSPPSHHDAKKTPSRLCFVCWSRSTWIIDTWNLMPRTGRFRRNYWKFPSQNRRTFSEIRPGDAVRRISPFLCTCERSGSSLVAARIRRVAHAFPCAIPWQASTVLARVCLCARNCQCNSCCGCCLRVSWTLFVQRPWCLLTHRHFSGQRKRLFLACVAGPIAIATSRNLSLSMGSFDWLSLSKQRKTQNIWAKRRRSR